MKHPITNQVRVDIKAAKKIWLPWWAVLTWMLFCIPVFALFHHFGALNMAMPMLGCVAIFGFFIYLKWELRREPLFWITVAVLAAMHGLVIWYIPWTSKWVPAVVSAGLWSIDLCALLWILAAVETLLGRREAH